MKPERWQTNAAGPFLTIGEVSVWTLGGDRLYVETPLGSKEDNGVL
jgi:hypothetical protein